MILLSEVDRLSLGWVEEGIVGKKENKKKKTVRKSDHKHVYEEYDVGVDSASRWLRKKEKKCKICGKVDWYFVFVR